MYRSADKVRGKNIRPRWVLCICLTLGLVWGFAGTTASGEVPADEYKRKAEFIHNFIRFSTWPAESFSIDKIVSQTSGTPHFVIGLLGEDPFGAALDQLAGKIVKGRSIVIVRFTDSGETCVLPAGTSLIDCPAFTDTQLLFISRSERDRIGPILARLKGRSVMTVSDMQQFADGGGMIGFTISNGVLRYRINPDAVRAANIELDLELASLGEIVPKPVRVVVLPGRSLGQSPLLRRLRGFEKGFYLALESNRGFVVTHTPDPDRAAQHGLDTLALDASAGAKIWFPAHHNEHARPNVKAVRDTVKGINAHLVLTYSAFGGSSTGLRIYLIDVRTDQVYPADIPTTGNLWSFPDVSWQVKQATNKLLQKVASVRAKGSASAPP